MRGLPEGVAAFSIEEDGITVRLRLLRRGKGEEVWYLHQMGASGDSLQTTLNQYYSINPHQNSARPIQFDDIPDLSLDKLHRYPDQVLQWGMTHEVMLAWFAFITCVIIAQVKAFWQEQIAEGGGLAYKIAALRLAEWERLERMCREHTASSLAASFRLYSLLSTNEKTRQTLHVLAQGWMAFGHQVKINREFRTHLDNVYNGYDRAQPNTGFFKDELIIYAGGIAVGSLGIQGNLHFKCAIDDGIFVAPGNCNHGYGRMLLDTALMYLRRKGDIRYLRLGYQRHFISPDAKVQRLIKNMVQDYRGAVVYLQRSPVGAIQIVTFDLVKINLPVNHRIIHQLTNNHHSAGSPVVIRNVDTMAGHEFVLPARWRLPLSERSGFLGNLSRNDIKEIKRLIAARLYESVPALKKAVPRFGDIKIAFFYLTRNIARAPPAFIWAQKTNGILSVYFSSQLLAESFREQFSYELRRHLDPIVFHELEEISFRRQGHKAAGAHRRADADTRYTYPEPAESIEAFLQQFAEFTSQHTFILVPVLASEFQTMRMLSEELNTQALTKEDRIDGKAFYRMDFHVLAVDALRETRIAMLQEATSDLSTAEAKMAMVQVALFDYLHLIRGTFIQFYLQALEQAGISVTSEIDARVRSIADEIYVSPHKDNLAYHQPDPKLNKRMVVRQLPRLVLFSFVDRRRGGTGSSPISSSSPAGTIVNVAERLGLHPREWDPYTWQIAKVDAQAVLGRLKGKPEGNLILVTAISPTVAGEGKTSVAVGLTQG
jgi:GNAT superfamily N-acetyltransferase